ncbi:MAG: hypothetical protein ACI8WL_000277 [Polaribacter sp.]|jgi:hypothetical protein|tara:strand:- start:1101 stop:1805 length:705 start_codon:yes stop_codon:yes gene_type:complete
MSSNPLQACLDILTSPRDTFDAIKDKKGWSWAPFGLVVVSTIALFLYYFSVVDFEWMLDQMLEQMAVQNEMSAEQLQATQEFMTKTSMTWSTLLGGAIGIIVINAFMAVYLNLITKVYSPNEMTFTAWYGFSWWTSMPFVISSLLAALVIMFSSAGMVSLDDLSPTSLGFLADRSSPWFGFFGGINLFSFWSIALGTIGLSSWLGLAAKKAFIIAVAPSLVIYGCWALYIGFSG